LAIPLGKDIPANGFLKSKQNKTKKTLRLLKEALLEPVVVSFAASAFSTHLSGVGFARAGFLA
jgi:hypothetical protein